MRLLRVSNVNRSPGGKAVGPGALRGTGLGWIWINYSGYVLKALQNASDLAGCRGRTAGVPCELRLLSQRLEGEAWSLFKADAELPSKHHRKLFTDRVLMCKLLRGLRRVSDWLCYAHNVSYWKQYIATSVILSYASRKLSNSGFNHKESPMGQWNVQLTVAIGHC